MELEKRETGRGSSDDREWAASARGPDEVGEPGGNQLGDKVLRRRRTERAAPTCSTSPAFFRMTTDNDFEWEVVSLAKR
jgi:hypothetical protein